ncbi:endonuclease I [Pseudoalteromonas luteoviolacea]|nr:endonuclease I [Pseudoalteromonas luteoviolacea]
MKHRKNHRFSIKTAVLIGLVCPTVSAEISNGSFENWLQSTPSNWSTIDTGITLSQVSSPIKDGQSAAAVTVNTATQGRTDLRQTISVTGGQSYTFSTWVYHTEGNVKARLYVDGYRGYSNENQTAQWQQLTYQYTANSSKNIEVGLRFYDTNGFDGSEVVYVDHFMPSDTTTTPPPPPTQCQQNPVQFKLVTDNYANETSWELKNKQGQVIKSGNGYANTTTYTESLCLADETYTFIISDSYGDGICCSQGNGSYELTFNNQVLVSGGQFSNQEQKQFTLGNGDGGGGQDPTGYYASAAGLSGFTLKSQLHAIIKDHNNRGYSALWSFIDQYERDSFFEKDNTVLDRYSEKPTTADTVSFTAVGDQCGSYRGEGDCYNREHSFPKSWFGGKVEPMNSDVHHIFASDGFVNAKRNSYPFGEVGSASYSSSNGSRLGSASGINYSGTVFEPIDQFKGDIARIYFYMATRYENVVAGWQNKSSYGNDVLNGTANVVFEPWVVALLKRWHQQDPVDDLERARNQAAYEYQGNRNPYVDHPEFVEKIW